MCGKQETQMALTISLFVFLILTSSLLSVFYRQAGAVSAKRPDTPPLFTAVWTGGTAIIYLIAALASAGRLVILPQTFLFGALAGIAFTAATYAYLQAMHSGPFIWNVLLLNLSALLPALFSVLFLKEPTSLHQICGMVLIFAVVVIMSVQPANIKTKGSASGKWLVLILTAFFTNGGVLILMKLQQYYLSQRENPPSQIFEYSFILFLTASLSGLILFLLHKGHFRIFPYKQLLLPAAGLAITIGLTQLFNLILATRVSGVVQFSIPNVMVILISALFSVIFYKEKLTLRLGISMLLSVAGILLI